MPPLALPKQTCQNLRKIQVKALAIQGKKKELYDNQHAEKKATNIELLKGKGSKQRRRNVGVQGGVPLSAAETNLPKALKDTSKRTCNSRKNKRTVRRKSSRNGVEGGVLRALTTEICFKKGKNKNRGPRGFHIFSHP